MVVFQLQVYDNYNNSNIFSYILNVLESVNQKRFYYEQANIMENIEILCVIIDYIYIFLNIYCKEVERNTRMFFPCLIRLSILSFSILSGRRCG